MKQPAIMKELNALFNPRSVAVVGATDNRGKWGFSTFRSVNTSFQGDIYPVNTKAKTVFDRQAFARVTDIPGPVDLAVIVVPHDAVLPVMKDCVEKGAKAAVIISAGFQETGEKGRKLQDQVLAEARKGGLRFVGPNCMGTWSASCNLNAFMAPMPVMDGPLAFVTQGGNVGGSILRSANEKGVGFREYVSCGAAADIQIEDYIEYFGNDPSVRIILAYIEGLTDGRRFVEKVSAVTKNKPVIVMKSGTTVAGSRAAMSHSGALAGSDAAYDAAFEASGVIRAQTIGEFLDTAIGFLTQPLPAGDNVAILTGGGSYGVLCADACEASGLNVVELPEHVIEELNQHLPDRWSHGNPVDPAGDRDFGYYLQIPELLLPIEYVDTLLFMGFGGFSQLGPDFIASGFTVGPMDQSPPTEDEFTHLVDKFLADIIISWLKKYNKPVLTTTFGEMSMQLEYGIYHYASPERAAMVLANLARYRKYLDKIGVTSKPDFDPFRVCLV